MAIPDNYIDKITKGNDSRMISPAADMVRVDNDNFEGETLDEVLDDVAQAISGLATTEALTQGLGGKQNVLTFDSTPTAGSNNPVKSGGIKTALDAKANAADVPTNQDMADAIDDALGEAQVTVVPAGSMGVISSLGSDSDTDALSASMGKKLKVAIITILNSLGNYAFPDGKPVIDWGDDTPVTYTVSKTIGTGLSATGGDSDVALGDALEVTISITNNLYIVDDDSVVVTMGGSPVQGAWNASTMKVTIAAVTGNVVINVPSLTYVSSGLAFQLDAKNGLDITNQKWTDIVGGIEFALTNVSLNQAGNAAVFNGSSSKGIANQGLNVSASTGTIEIIATRASNTAVSPIMRNAYGTGCITAHMEVNNSRKVFEFYVANNDSIPAGGNYGIVCEDLNVAISANHERALVNGTVYTGNRYNNIVGLSGVAYPLTIGYSKRNGNDIFLNGTIMAIRVYSGTLSEQDMKRNYSIDKKRFNLA